MVLKKKKMEFLRHISTYINENVSSPPKKKFLFEYIIVLFVAVSFLLGNLVNNTLPVTVTEHVISHFL